MYKSNRIDALKIPDMKSLAALVICSVLPCNPVNASVVWSVNNHEYSVVEDVSATWNSANSAAQSLGSGWHLATVTSAAENSFITSLLTTTGDRYHYWIGATDLLGNSLFTWGTGESFVYTNWFPGEPNNGGGTRNIAYDYRGRWAWNDVQNPYLGLRDLARGYVIERSQAVPLPSSLTLILTSLGLLGLFANRRLRALDA